MAIQFVGYAEGTRTTGISSYSISLTALAGGIDTSPKAGDLLIVIQGWAGTANGNPAVSSPAGFTEVADLYADGTSHDANFAAAWMIAGSTPPTSVTVTSIAVANNGSAAAVLVFRGVDQTTPLDATTTTATGTGTADADPAAITPATDGAWIIAAALAASGNASTFSAPSGYTLLETTGANGSSRSATIGSAYKSGSAGVSDNPGVMTFGGGAATAGSWAAVTLALRPASGNIKVYDGSAFTAKPVKVWNGSAWVRKLLKRWNGSSWVPTSY